MKTIKTAYAKKNNKKSKLANTGFDPVASTLLQEVSKVEEKYFYAILESNPQGLSENTVSKKQEIFGLNQIQHHKPDPWYVQLISAFINPFILVLIAIAIVSSITDIILSSIEDRDYTTVIVVGIMVVLSALLRFWQEYSSNRAAERLKEMVKTTAAVIRKNKPAREIEIEEIVPGDLIQISAGDMIPADCRVVKSKDLFITQAMLTGESMPVEKHEFPIPDAPNRTPLELENLCFMGTNVISGTALVIAVNTSNLTHFGTIGKSLTEKRSQTSFDKGVNKVSMLLIKFMLVMVPMVYIINGLTKGDWLEAFLFGIAVAVGLTPEMLPMIVTANLAKGAKSMSKEKVIVKRLNAIQNLGAMDVFCTDKTGTLTRDKIILEKHLNVHGVEDDEVLKWAYLNSFHQTGLKNLLDLAVLEHVELREFVKVESDYVKIDEIPFDFQRRRMSVVLKQKNGKHLLVCKGAVEEMLPLCDRSFEPGENRQLHLESDQIVAMNQSMQKVVLENSKSLNEDGLRVLLVAIKEYEERPLNYSVEDEKDMILTGFIGFLDPPKDSAKPAIKELQNLGVEIKVLTGDNETVTKKICSDVGISIQNLMMGQQIENMDDSSLSEALDKTNVIAKLNPLQKSRIVKILQKKGHSVGFMGDGINDAAALRQADVGISVDNAVDIAKESADIILLEKDLMVLKNGIINGRRTFGNIIKYIKMAASSNFGNMFSVVGASVFLPFLPMLPIQLLIQNLLYDISQISIPWDNMDKEFMEKPQKWDASGIKRFMFYIGPTSSIFDYVTFGVMFYVFKANMPEHQTLFQTGWFVEGLLSQTLIVHMIRTRKIPFIQSWASAPVVALTSLIILIGLAIPFTPFASALYMQPLPLAYFPWLVGILISYCLLTQVVKNWYIRKFNQWL